MDIAYLHIITNHIPIIGVPLALFLLALGIWRKSDELKTASFLIFVLLGFAVLGTFLLGQGGEDFVEDVAGVSEQAIEDHENFARFALASVAATAILSLFALLRYQGFSFLKRGSDEKAEPADGENAAAAKVSSFPNWIAFAVLILALASSAILGYTGKLGGKIRHTEFYGGAPTEETDGKNRRGRSEPKPEKVLPVTDTQTDTQGTQETAEESGKGRGRNRGKK
jgi:hypothetical protein